METLAYLYLAASYEASAFSETETAWGDGLFFQKLDWTKCRIGALMPLSLFAIALTSLTFSSPALALKRGNRSSEVISLQKKLEATGYFSGPITGYYGSLTEEAVIKFQKAKGLTPDGIAGSLTLSALESSLTAAAPSSPTTPPAAIADHSKVENGSITPTPSASATPPAAIADHSKVENRSITPTPSASATPPAAIAEHSKVENRSITPTPSASATPPAAIADHSKVENRSITPTPSASATPPAAIADNSKVENRSSTPTPSASATPPVAVTDNSKVENHGNLDNPKKTSPSLATQMKLKKTISGDISPKSVVYSGKDLFFAQNMMYSHTITVYDREHKLVKTIPDTVNLSKYGYSKFAGKYKGAPVEASFSHNGKYAWVSNYKMYGPGFNNPGSDKCNPSQNTDQSFLYRINTETLEIEHALQVGSVPKFVAVSPDSRLVLVSNWCTWDLSVVDTQENREIKRIKLGPYPRGIVVDAASEKAYVAVMGSEDIARVDLKDYSVEQLRNIGNSPRHLNIDPAGKYLYASLNGEGKIAKIDLSAGKVLKKVVTGNAPRSMVISDDGQVLYVVNYGDNTVSKVRTSDMEVLQKVSVDANPIGITYDPQTRKVWVACYSGTILVFQD